jgi:hypothetical protein
MITKAVDFEIPVLAMWHGLSIVVIMAVGPHEPWIGAAMRRTLACANMLLSVLADKC